MAPHGALGRAAGDTQSPTVFLLRRLKAGRETAERSIMFDDRDYQGDSAYTLALPPSSRENAASDICIRVDDGADLVIDVGNQARGRINAYLTVDQAEDLLAALSEILRLPADRTGALGRTGPIKTDTDGDGIPRSR